MSYTFIRRVCIASTGALRRGKMASEANPRRQTQTRLRCCVTIDPRFIRAKPSHNKVVNLFTNKRDAGAKYRNDNASYL